MKANSARILAVLVVGQVGACTPIPAPLPPPAAELPFGLQQNQRFRRLVPAAQPSPEPETLPFGPPFGGTLPPGPGAYQPDDDEAARRAEAERYRWQHVRLRDERWRPYWERSTTEPTPFPGHLHVGEAVTRPFPFRRDLISGEPAPGPTPPIVK